ncbi:MAG: phosphate ABC transporter permease PstA [Acidimicrobiia bacterium]
MSVEAPSRPVETYFPTDEEYEKHLGGRTRRGLVVKSLFLLALIIAVVALVTLLFTIINDSFGLVAIVNQQEPEQIVASLGYNQETTGLADLSYDDLVAVLQGGISNNVGRRLERDQRFYEDHLVFESEDVWAEICSSDEPPEGCDLGPRTQASVLQLVEERIVQPDIIEVNTLLPSITSPDEFRQRVETTFIESPDRYGDYTFDQVQFQWRAWLNPTFVLTPASGTPETAGIRTAVLGSLWIVVITIAFAVPVGVGAAVYLEEFARPSRFSEFIQTNINNLAGVPSIIYGILGLAILVRVFEPFTSGRVFGLDNVNGRTVISAGLTLGLLTLPVVIISSQEALKAVPNSLRQAGLALGATKWQTVRSQILPVAVPGIMTGTILAVARAIGETAPLIVVGAASFITADPTGPFSKYTALPIQIFQWTSLPQVEWKHLAAAASLFLLIMLLILNAGAVILRNRYSRRPS